MDAGERRKSDRVSIAVPIRVSGTDAAGQAFEEQTRTVVISRDGATIVLNRKLAPGQYVTISRVKGNKAASAQVVGQIGGQPHGYIYGMAVQHPTCGSLWDILFPPLEESEKAAIRLLLECTSCQAREVAYLNELEVEVFEANRSLSRACKQCSEWTVWKQLPSLLSDEADVVSAPAAQAPPTSNRRKEARAQLTMSACIRQPGFGEEIALIENISRGGLRFLSPNTYFEGSRVEVAAPYSPEAANIFVPARIVRVRERPDKGLTEYGVEYMKTHRSRPEG